MNLPDFLQHEGLNRLRQRMGAEFIEWNSERDWDPISIVLETKGLDISPDDLEYPDDGTLEYKGRKVVVYIRDQNVHFQPYKFHVANCKTLSQMKAQNQYDRYVVATRSDGMFAVNSYDNSYDEGRLFEEGTEHRLAVCINCLRALNYKDYDNCSHADQREIIKAFELQEFFLEYPSQITPTPIHTETTAPLNEYTSDWPEISLRHRLHKNWKCERCRGDFNAPESHHLLHVHHINGIRYDNRTDNLRVLCSKCHSLEPQHEHMRRDLD